MHLNAACTNGCLQRDISGAKGRAFPAINGRRSDRVVRFITAVPPRGLDVAPRSQ
jgi:hypothetical protein